MSAPERSWSALAGPTPVAVAVAGSTLRRGSRVRVWPRARDALDGGLHGREAVVDGIDQDDAGRLHIAVMLVADPGRDLGAGRCPGPRFYCAPEELEPLAGGEVAPRILVAGIGNEFLGDDGFGSALVRSLAAAPGPSALGPDADVVDFGIRGLDLAYALARGYGAAVLVDATRRGGAPGTLYVLEPPLEPRSRPGTAPLTHGVDPVHALRLARALGASLGPLRIVGCEPAWIPDEDGELDAAATQLSAPLRRALPAAAALLAGVVAELRALLRAAKPAA